MNLLLKNRRVLLGQLITLWVHIWASKKEFFIGNIICFDFQTQNSTKQHINKAQIPFSDKYSEYAQEEYPVITISGNVWAKKYCNTAYFRTLYFAVFEWKWYPVQHLINLLICSQQNSYSHTNWLCASIISFEINIS